MSSPLQIAFFGSSLLSAYWNGAATYYRGIIRALARLGHRITFYEPDAYGRQQHRDIPVPSWAEVVVYANDPSEALRQVERAATSQIIVKASGVGVFDELLESAVLAQNHAATIFWDVDAPATLNRLKSNPCDPFRSKIPKFDLILTYGGGEPVQSAYKQLGAKECVPIYNGVDEETHFPTRSEHQFESTLAFLGNRLPDREARVEEFFLGTARRLPDRDFVLGGNGWAEKDLPSNVRYLGHIATSLHNAFNSSALAILNISRNSMAQNGYSPATRVFEAAGASSCMITDYWVGIDRFFEPDREILVAEDSSDVAEHLMRLTPKLAREIGAAARKRVLADHTYSQRAREVEPLLQEIC